MAPQGIGDADETEADALDGGPLMGNGDRGPMAAMGNGDRGPNGALGNGDR